MSNRTLVALLVGLVLAMVLILAPVSLVTSALGRTGLMSASGARGTVWSGSLDNVVMAGSPVGDLKLGLSPLALLTGQARLGLRQRAGFDGRAVLFPGGAKRGVEGLTWRMPVDLTETGLPVAGVATFKDAAAVFRKGQCVRAGGQIELRLAGEGPLGGVVLSGAPVCRRESWVSTLSGAAGAAKVSLATRIDGTGRFQVETMIVTTDEPTIQSLLANGFLRDAVGARRTVDGQWTRSAQARAK